MNRQLTNPWWAILLLPAAIFLIYAGAGFPPDWINLAVRLYVFVLLIFVGARYVGRAPVLMWQANLTPESRNIGGWALALVSMAFVQAYAWLFITLARPAWLTSSYWSPSFVVLMGVGLTLVASSIRKNPPASLNDGGLPVAASFVVGFLSACGLFIAGHVPEIAKLFS